MEKSTANKNFYNSINDAWLFIMGGNFHWGYFLSESDSLDMATNNLINAMSNLVKPTVKDKIIDIGCGIGHPAFHLHALFGSEVFGVSISENGINEANILAEEKGFQDKTSFFVMDAMNLNFPDNAFDIAWIMESSHLMPSKTILVNEAVRVLKPQGRIVLCDLMLQRPLKAREILKYQEDLKKMEKSFGQAKLDTLQVYQNIFAENNIQVNESFYISESVIKTLDCWKNNIENNWDKLSPYFSINQKTDFLETCDFLKYLYESEIWGYGIISGTKILYYE
ncbi:MAG: hypothetical protein A2W91_07235 [Bacteroidetes bacterium GWF2_38_335]|nr:MAG: hypothetical protein A2W91_07235 [Bacteroidetes bacterium GWF2_38_335]OFY77121.1 MAG: hypothetical protein A2281_14470 [Bacteroidetes bacterium RIFOXYA12_FULL_38_20]HBS85012.1 hypothetical protein [Bacteroidales bacterium]